jgi:phosphatidylethanolamine-binding protein (PEBP) family uncharacterized protein
MALLGRLMRRVRAGEHRSPLAAPDFDAPATITVTSPAFTDGGTIPRVHAGQGVGDNISPALAWRGVPIEAKQLLLVVQDVDAPLPRPLLHTAALLEAQHDKLGEGALRPGTPWLRFIRGTLRNVGYAGPRPIPGHGPHRYQFHLLALDQRVPSSVRTIRALFDATAHHVLARGVLTGTYQR